MRNCWIVDSDGPPNENQRKRKEWQVVCLCLTTKKSIEREPDGDTSYN